MKRLLQRPEALALGARALGAYLQFALRTTRWTLHGREQVDPFMLDGRAIFAFWHERLPLMPALWTLARDERRGTGARMHVLVSQHKDGRLIGGIMRRFGVDLVFGSTSSGRKQRGGAAGLRALAGVLGAGDQVVITPDGPRGPRRQAAPGVAQLAAMTGAPVVPCAAQTTRRRVLPSWDRMVLPLPWGRGVLVCGAPLHVPAEGAEACLPRIEAALTAATETADALCAA